MAEKTLYEIGNQAGKEEILLTDKRLILKQDPLVKYENDVREIPLSKVKSVNVSEMDFSASFVLNWIGVEIALLLVFFGLTSASLPMFHVYRILMGSPAENPLGQVGKLLISAVMIGAGILLVPQFDGVILKVVSTDGKQIRYLKNVDYRPALQQLKLKIMQKAKR